MSPRKKKSPAVISVEAIVWHDASFEMREKLDTSPLLVHTVGFMVHEDATQVILAHEVKSVEDWMDEDMDYTKIPVTLIRTRATLAEVPIQRESSDEVVEEETKQDGPRGEVQRANPQLSAGDAR